MTGILTNGQIMAYVFFVLSLLAVSGWPLAALHYLSEKDWRWNEDLTFWTWLKENRFVLCWCSFLTTVSMLGLVFH